MSTAPFLLLPYFLSSPPPRPNPSDPHGYLPSSSAPQHQFRVRVRATAPRTLIRCSTSDSGSRTTMSGSKMDDPIIDCVGTGKDVECFVVEAAESDQLLQPKKALSFEIQDQLEGVESDEGLARRVLEWVLLVSPFFFWGTAMVAMKEVIPKTGPFFVSAFRLIPAGLMLIGFAGIKGRRMPSGTIAWISILLFGFVDATCFQGFLSEGLQKTSAGLGSSLTTSFFWAVAVAAEHLLSVPVLVFSLSKVIIDSQPLTVCILAAVLFGESIGVVGAAGLVLGVVGLLLLEVPALSLEGNSSAIWGSGEWWMLLAAQSMAVGTVMVRWVSKYSDPVMATGWHMVIGGLPLLAISVLNHDPAVSGGLKELTSSDLLGLLYTSVFGSAISYGLYFYNATKGSLTKLSSLTFLTPMFASFFGFLYLGETFSSLQLAGALVTVVAIYMVNYRENLDKS